MEMCCSSTAMHWMQQLYTEEFSSCEPTCAGQFRPVELPPHRCQSCVRLALLLVTPPDHTFHALHYLTLQMLLKDLDFNLVVFNPYRPLQSYLMDAGAPQEIAQAAWAALNDSFKCDAPLMYPPHVLALGCLVFAASVAPLRASLVPPPEQLPAHPGQQQIQGMGSLPDSHGAAAQQHATPAYAPGAAMGAATGQTDPGLTAAPPGPGGTSGAATSLATSDGKLLQAQGPTLLAAPHQQAPGASTGAAGGDGSVAAWDVGQWLATVNIDLEQVGEEASERVKLHAQILALYSDHLVYARTHPLFGCTGVCSSPGVGSTL
jgi:hypothetical protein